MKKLLFILLLILIAAQVSAVTVYKRAESALRYTTGGTVVVSSNAQIWVYNSGTVVPATLYSNADGSTVLAQPVRADKYGNYEYYAPLGQYDETIIGPVGTNPSYRYWNTVGPVTGGGGSGVTYCTGFAPTNGQTIQWYDFGQCFKGYIPPGITYCTGFDPTNGQTLQWDAAGQCFKGYTASGFGDVIGASDSSDGELPLFSGGGGKTLRRSNTLSGIPKLTSGVVSMATANTDYVLPTLYSSSTVTGLLKPADWTTFNNKLATNGSGASLTGITYTQVGAQAAAANLTSLSSPGTWKLFYSNGSSTITELGVGAYGLILTGTGVSSAPTFTNNIVLPKSSGVAGQSCLYTSYLTDLFGICEEGPSDHRTANLILKRPNGNPTQGQVLAYTAPDINGVAQGSWMSIASNYTTTGLTTGQTFTASDFNGMHYFISSALTHTMPAAADNYRADILITAATVTIIPSSAADVFRSIKSDGTSTTLTVNHKATIDAVGEYRLISAGTPTWYIYGPALIGDGGAISPFPVSDNFNRADANPIGGNWTTLPSVNACQLLTNKGCASSSTSGCYWNANSPNADQYVQYAYPGGSIDNQRVYARASTSVNTKYYLNLDSATVLQVWKIVAGSGTSLGTRTISTIQTNDVVKLSVSGTGATVTLKVYLNDVQQGADITDTAGDRITSAGVFGWGTSSGGACIDNWTGGDL